MGLVQRFGVAALMGAMAAVALASPRSTAAKRAFQRAVPCPSTGAHRGSCPGYVIDHVVPLCAGGADAPSNMQYQTISDGRAKDRVERRECASLRRR